MLSVLFDYVLKNLYKIIGGSSILGWGVFIKKWGVFDWGVGCFQKKVGCLRTFFQKGGVFSKKSGVFWDVFIWLKKGFFVTKRPNTEKFTVSGHRKTHHMWCG